MVAMPEKPDLGGVARRSTFIKEGAELALMECPDRHEATLCHTPDGVGVWSLVLSDQDGASDGATCSKVLNRSTCLRGPVALSEKEVGHIVPRTCDRHNA